MVRFVLYAILAFVLYQFIFKLVIPVYLATRKIKKGFREMQEKMHQQQSSQPQPPPQASPKTKVGDYIDFEEVK